MASLKINSTSTVPFDDQKPGTSGLRKPTKFFTEKSNYTENFIASILQTINVKNSTLIVGGDGRYFIKDAIAKIIKLAAGNENVSKLIIAQNGILSTPAASNLIIKNKAIGGILLTASHNPGGPDADFGIKYNCSNGGPAPSKVTDEIFEISKKITCLKSVNLEVDFDKIGDYEFDVEGEKFVIQVIDSVSDYELMCKSLFNFDKISNLFKTGFKIKLDCMHGVIGPYATKIIGQTLGAGQNSIMNNIPHPTFNNLHPDPNLVHAASLVQFLEQNPDYQLGAAFDGDGDRNMVLGQNGFFIAPSDSLALILEHGNNCIPYFQANGGIKGVARSMPTSAACDKVAEILDIPCFQTPTGWKYFGALMDNDKISLCGEESFGTGSTHIREKDGLWAVLAWLSILSEKMPHYNANDLVLEHWKTFGRHYYSRWDYEDMDSNIGKNLMAQLEDLVLKFQQNVGFELVSNDTSLTCRSITSFEYTDLDGTIASKQGIVMKWYENQIYHGRSIIRLSGTSASGATLRLYLEKFEQENLDIDFQVAVKKLQQASNEIAQIEKLSGMSKPSVIS